ncbi:MAG: CopD family protein [Thermoproteota archaeon]|nr:CopD family protein [Thermoproteota archaeon]
MVNKKKLYKFILPVLTLGLCTFIIPSITFAQQESNYYGNSESVTSVNDAIIKSILVIFQVSALGLTFNHLLFNIISSKKNNNPHYKSKINESDNIRFTKRFIIIVVFVSVAIIASSTGLMLLQSYELSQNLSLDIAYAFSLLYNTSVGQVWIIRIITAAITTGLVFSIGVTNKIVSRKKSNHNPNLKDIGKMSNRISLTLLLGVIICSSVNLFSNSMVSHSNSLSSSSYLAVVTDWTHFMAVSFWIGGLFYLSTTFIQKIKLQDREVDESSKTNIDIETINKKNNIDIANSFRVAYHFSSLLMYFSLVAIVSLGIIGLTGLYLSLNLLQSINSLFITSYGQILLIKIGLTFFMIFLGRYNQIKIRNYAMSMSKVYFDGHVNNIRYKSDIHRENNEDTYNSFKTIDRSIKIESLIGVSVLVVASFLTITSPPALEPPTGQTSHGIVNLTKNMEYLQFFALVVVLSIAITILGMINFKRNLHQIREVYFPATQ